VLGRRRVALEQGGGGDQQAGRAEPALQATVLDERVLERGQVAVIGKALDGDDLPAIRLRSQHQARARRAPVHHHGAGAAVAVRAALFRTCQPQPVT
jgi:hypothetical protein